MNQYNIEKYSGKNINKFIDTPFIPGAPVTLAAMSDRYPKLSDAIRSYGISVVPVTSYKCNTANPESSHADMQILPVGGRKAALIKNNDKLNDVLLDFGFERVFVEEIPESFAYPECTRLNFAILGRNIIGNFKHLNENNLELFNRFNKIPVRQGYAKCSTAIVTQNSVITSDCSIHKACLQNGIDCLKISEGHISLCSRYGGFIGGACFLIDSKTLAFTGNIKSHPDYINIKSFCSNYGVSLLSLTNDALCDVGGIVPLMQSDG